MTDNMGRMHSDAQFAGSSPSARRHDGPHRHGQQPVVCFRSRWSNQIEEARW
ncbi:MAG: GGGtGRT protein [Cloacibacillus evryensis]